MSCLLGILPRERVPVARSNQVITAGVLALATSDEDLGKLGFHAEVVAWCRQGPFLPARHGTPLDEDTVRGVTACEEMLLTRLHHLEDRAELALTLCERPSASSATGREFLKARARRQDAFERARDVFADLQTRFAPYGLLTSSRGSLHLAVLARACEMTDIRSLAETTEQAIRDTHRIHVSGPWPPYSFGTTFQEAQACQNQR